MIAPMNETPLEAATRQIAEAEQRWDRQIDLIAKLARNGKARTAAEERLLKIRATLRITRAQQALLRDIED